MAAWHYFKRFRKINATLYVECDNGAYYNYKGAMVEYIGQKDLVVDEESSYKRSNKNKKNLSEFGLYKKMCHNISNLNNVNLQDIDKRAFNGHHVDHKISIKFGYNHGISIEDIAHSSNLRVISDFDNMRKGVKCFVDSGNRWILEKYNISINDIW